MVITRSQHHQIFIQEFQRLSRIEMEHSDPSISSDSTVYRPLLTSNMEQEYLRTLAKEQVKTLHKFSGSNSEDVIHWLQCVEQVFDRALLQPVNKYIAVQFYLHGAAAKWFQFNKSNINDWGTFKSELIKVYQPSFHQSLLRMEQRHQTLGESVMEYYHDKMHLCTQADPHMSSPMIIHYLTKGVNDSLLSHIIRRHPKTPDEFLTIAQDEEKIQATLNGLSHNSATTIDNYPNDDSYVDPSVTLVTRPINQHTRSYARQQSTSYPQPLMNLPSVSPQFSFRRDSPQHLYPSNTTRQCYNCYQFGHVAKFCPNRKNM
ncbi:unnamed protein product [Rotaria socialis]|nr:unnamed protein product [Rotaria socialis]CAF3405477.1 unnamed protein product [Rotaria socialis]CAF3465287.1 unnamed protein product [Rotaria socialis]CAF3513822.1 unnamed protein product [Rotaria socialis]CAF3648446.1 unnamed protein product [Rotaria socialis]